MRVLVAAATVCGWPTAVYLSAQGYEVLVVDNLAAGLGRGVGYGVLDPVSSLRERGPVEGTRGAWVGVAVGDLTDERFVYEVWTVSGPRRSLHFAEQRSAPYSMIDRATPFFTQVTT